jgi:LysM repeat protein
MKILKFSGIVVGIHLLALFLIFANPGCSSSTKPPPSKTDTVTAAEAPPAITVAPSGAAPDKNASPISFNTDSVRYSPTRPGTPAASTLEVEPVNNVIPASTYTVVTGDNLSVIAKKNHLTLSELAAANNLNVTTAKLRPGQKLIIPGKTPAPAKPAETAAHLASASTAPAITGDTAASKAPGDVVKHTVKSGESLSSIAQKYGVKVGDIAAANSISDPQKIRLGQELVIPGWQAPASRSSRTTKSGGENAKPSPAPNPAPPSGAISDPNPRTPAPMMEVPVIQVEEAPAPAK